MDFKQDGRRLVSKLAIVNPYLQGSHKQIAESESSKRFIRAANNLGIDAKVFASSEHLDRFKPDLVVAITYQEGKLTKYPTYGSLNAPVAMFKNVPRFTRNILSYDGYLTLSNSVHDWLIRFCHSAGKKAYIGKVAFSVPRMAFKKCDFKQARAMYMGTNWDGMRHQELFELLASGEYLKCYGPSKSWRRYKGAIYGGSIPFNGLSSFVVYRSNAAGLCLGHPLFDDEGIASSRTFEIAAASALPICANNNVLTKQYYGDAVLYIDNDVPTSVLAEQIVDTVKWIRSNPNIAQEMAYQANTIFNKQLAMETFIENLITLHHTVITETGYTKQSVTTSIPMQESIESQPKVALLVLDKHATFNQVEPLLLDLQQQNYTNIEIILLQKNAKFLAQKIAHHRVLQTLIVHAFPYTGTISNAELFAFLEANRFTLIGLLSSNVRLFPNHVFSLVNKWYRKHESSNIAAICAANLEFSHNCHLPERMWQEHKIITHNKTRIGHLEFNNHVPLAALLINFNLFKPDFNVLDFQAIDVQKFIKKLSTLGEIVESKKITCKVNVDRGWQKIRGLAPILNRIIRMFN